MLRRLAALGRRRRSDSDHGGVTAIVSVVLATGVMLGMGALVIDVGQLYLEREQLQTGADAASMKVAIACAKGSTCTRAARTDDAVTYAKSNAKDLAADAEICINNQGCPTWKTAVSCPPMPAPPAGTQVGEYVEVRTTTVTTTGSTLLPPTFAGALSGQNYKGKQVGACARVNWGQPYVEKVFAMGISLCDWKRMTNDNTLFYGPIGTLLGQAGLYSALGLPKPTAGVDDAIPQVTSLTAAGLPLPYCLQPPPFGDASSPRGYVWLSHPDLTPPDSNCMISVKPGDLPRSFLLSGLLIGTACALKLASFRGTGPILVPIYDKVMPVLLSVAPQYRVVGFAPFVVTGYTGLLTGVLTGVGSLLTAGLAPGISNLLCGLSACVYGYFTKTLIPKVKPVFGTGQNFGAVVIGRTG